MRTNTFYFAFVASTSLMWSTSSFAQDMDLHQQHDVIANTQIDQSVEAFDHKAHAKEHGGQNYQLTTIESKWTQNKSGHGAVQSELETWFGGDIHKVFFRAAHEKAESEQSSYSSELLYSRNIADFWDLQAGVRYRYDDAKTTDKDQVDAVVGLYGMAQYFFETEAYLYAGQDQRWSMSLHSERDILLTQKLIVQPYVGADIVLRDQSKFAEKSGLSSVEAGLETRYEISKKFMPFIDVSYQYKKGVKETPWQAATATDKDWYYGAGLRVKF